MRKLLLLTYHFPPSAASGTFRMLGFARHLPKFGWRTIVVAPPELPGEPVDRQLLDRVGAGTTVHAVPYPRRVPKILHWAAGANVWLPRALSACLRIVRTERPEAVLTSGPPQWVHLLGLYLKRRHRLPWLADFRDPWISDGSTRRLTGSRRWARFWENQVMRHADRILANAPAACACYQAAYPQQAARIITLTNGFDPENYPPYQDKIATGPVHIVHTGELYAGRDPGAFLDALQALQRLRGPDERPFHANFLGRSTTPTIDLAKEARQRGLESLVQGGDQVSYGQSLLGMSQADILLLLDSPGRRIGVPAKLYEYLGTGRPVLALAEADSDTALILKESGVIHRVASPTDPVSIQGALAELRHCLAEANPDTIANPGLQCFTREYLAGRLAAVLNECVASG